MDESASLLLDGQTLQNLEVLRNSTDGGPDGTLHALLNQAVSPFGTRPTASSGRVATRAHIDAARVLVFLGMPTRGKASASSSGGWCARCGTRPPSTRASTPSTT